MMVPKIRKLAVGLVALSVLAGVFLLYRRVTGTQPIVIDAAESVSAPAGDANEPGEQGAIGDIAGVGVGKVRETDFVHRDEAGRIDKRFGFHELLHEKGNQWEVSKPYMDLFLPEVVCRVTADHGTVQLDEVFGRPMPTDAMFTGHVVIHLIPTDPASPWECFIHLDDVGFLAEKSLFSSTGAVRFLSRPVRVTGTGMELVYNTARSRVELFRIFDLDSLRTRSSEVEAAAKASPSGSERPVAVSSETGQGTGEIASADVGEARVPPADANMPSPDVYQCVFRKNVRLESPRGVASVGDVLAINNIQWSRPAKSASTSAPATDPNKPVPAVPPDANALDTTASSYVAMSSIPEELYDIVVTCDGGAAITLTNGPYGLAETATADTSETPPAEAAPEEIVPSERPQAVAWRLDYDFLTNDATALGPFAANFVIDSNSLGEKTRGEPMPAVVTAQKAVHFHAAAEQIVLEGDCTATVHKSDPNASDEFRLAAPRMTADLTIDSNATDGVKVNLRKFVADAGDSPVDTADSTASPPVTVRLWRRTSDKTLGRGGLDAWELQYIADQNQFMASGPGDVWLHNNATVQPKDDPNAMPLKPCYVLMRNFDTLTYWSLSNRIVAEDDSQQLLIDYFPLVEDKPGPQTAVVAGHVEATLRELPGGRMDMVSLTASQGIAYDSEADHSNFSGSEMVYDRTTSLMVIRGDDIRPCNMNGVLVDQIVVNPKTGQIEAQPLTSVFQVGP